MSKIHKFQQEILNCKFLFRTCFCRTTDAVDSADESSLFSGKKCVKFCRNVRPFDIFVFSEICSCYFAEEGRKSILFL